MPILGACATHDPVEAQHRVASASATSLGAAAAPKAKSVNAHSGGYAPAEEGLDLVAMWRVAWGHRLLIVITSIVTGLIAVYLAMTATEMYRAETVVTEADAQGMGGGSALAGQLGSLASLAGVNLGGLAGGPSLEARALLKSRYLVEEFIRREKILGLLLEGTKQKDSLWFGVEYFRKNVLSIREDERNGTTTVSITWTDPALAAQWANGLVRLTNELLRDKALRESKRNIEYLNNQIAQTNVVEVQRVMYSLIESETKQLMLANARPEFAFAIVDPAVTPEQRISPRRTLMVALGLILGTILGVVVAFVLDATRVSVSKRRVHRQEATPERT